MTVYAILTESPDERSAVFAALYEVGYSWEGGLEDFNETIPFIGGEKLFINPGRSLCYSRHDYISPGETLLDITEFLRRREDIFTRMNNKYVATVKDGTVKIGCQNFSFDSILNLEKLITTAAKAA